MLQNIKKRNEGFTIIEVLIVLAIAGLILLIVFLAVPALQRNSRNTQVRNDAAKLGGLLQETINNNNGAATTGTTTPQVMVPANANLAKVTTVNYNISATGFQALPAALAQDTVYVRNYSICAAGGNGRIGVTGGTQRQYALTYLIETPGTPTANGVPAGTTAQCIGQ